MSEPASRFSKIVATGIRVFLNTHAPLTLPGTLSTTGIVTNRERPLYEPPSSRIAFYMAAKGDSLPHPLTKPRILAISKPE
jgi:hypothetical protein